MSERELSIDSLAAGGDGIGRDEGGRATFVPRSAPGDRLRVELVEEHARYARGRVLEILEPSADRADPPCPLFRAGTCGGCQWQHVSIDAQRRAKEELVASALRRAVGAGLEILPIATPVSDYRWRRRTRLHWFRRKGDAAALIGFMAPGTRRVTQVEACVQLEPALETALVTLHEILAPGLHKKGEIELLLGAGGAVHAAVHGPASAAAVATLVGQGGIVGARAGKRQFGAEALDLDDSLTGRADWFAQASVAGNEALVAEVAGAAGSLEGARVLELFAGSGNFTRVLAATAREVVAVDTTAPKQDAPGRVRWRRGRADEVTARLAAAGDRFVLAVLDPPRTGAREVMAPLAALGPDRIVYVSCDPATLGRDLEALIAAGYAPLSARPLDLMPQTAHVEVVAVLERR